MEIEVWKTRYAGDFFSASGKELRVSSGKKPRLEIKKNISLHFLQLEMANEKQAKINGWEF